MFKDNPFFVSGGTLRPTTPSYIERAADRQMHAALMLGEFCYVLETRQVGKSSLVARTAHRIRAEGRVNVATIDLQRYGQAVTSEQWYEAQVNQLAEDLGLEDEIDEFWDGLDGTKAVDRWIRTIVEGIVLKQRRSIRWIGSKARYEVRNRYVRNLRVVRFFGAHALPTAS